MDPSATLDALEANHWRDLYRCRYDKEHRAATLPVLARLLGDPSGQIRQRALRAVGRIAATDTLRALSSLVPLVCEQSRDADLLTRQTAVGVLHAIGADNPKAAIPALVAASGEKALLDNALLALIELGAATKPALALYQRCATHPQGKVRRLALRGYQAAKGTDPQSLARSLAIVRAALEDPNQQVRLMAQKVLAELERET